MSNKCLKCDSSRLMDVSAKCSDMCTVKLDGYAPGNVNIGGGDYLEFVVCANCGHLQGKWPLNDRAHMIYEDEDDLIEESDQKQ